MVAPALLVRLIGQNVGAAWYYVPLIYFVYCAASMLALLFIRETRELNLEDLDASPPVTPRQSTAFLPAR
jgi:hypothetical protein